MRSKDEDGIFDSNDKVEVDVFNDEELKTYNRTFAQTFFTIISWVLWIGGFIFAGFSALVSVGSDTQFSFTVFISTFVIYFISGCFSFCVAELFKILQKILNTLNETKEMMSKW